MEKEVHYYLKIVGYILLGLAVLGSILGAAYLIFVHIFNSAWPTISFFVNYVLPALFIIAVIIIILIVLYITLYIGVVLSYIWKPMKVSKKDKGYGLKRTREAGKRRKGSSRKR